MVKRQKKKEPKILISKLKKILGWETQLELSEILGYHESTISIMLNYYHVSKPMRRTIERVTKGEIKYKDWLV